MEHASSRSAAAAPLRDGRPSDGLERHAAAIESQLIPRLMATHRAGAFSPEALARAGAALSEARVEDLVRRLRAPDDALLDGFVEELLEAGVTSEAIYVDLLAPAARRLGTMWEEDTCDFVEVTLALGRMQRVLRSLSHLFLAAAVPDEPAGRIFLTSVPGEQHTLGLVMVAEFFVREGWSVDFGHPLHEADLLNAVRTERYDVVGFSLACDSSLPRLKREVRDVRRVSANRALRVIVGGRVFDENPQLVARVGADATARDPREAPRAALALRK